MNDDELLAALGEALHAPDRTPDPERIAALRRLAAERSLLEDDDGERAVLDHARAGTPADEVGAQRGARRARRQAEDDRRRASRRAVLRGGAAAGIGAVVGAAGVLATRREPDADDGPPTEPVAFASLPDGVTVAGRTIDHTWGMELLLDVAGLPAGAEYEVRYATAAGDVAAGGFLAVEAPMHCRFNGTPLRAAVTAVDVVDTATGTSVLRGTLA